MTKKLTLMVPDDLIDTIEENKDTLGSLVEMLQQSIKRQIEIGENVQKALTEAGLKLFQTKSDDE